MTAPSHGGGRSPRSAAFAPARLQLARQLRALTKSELAQRVGVTAAAVTQYELGQVSPSVETRARLALTLGMPVEFFSAERLQAPLDVTAAHFRSLRATTKMQRGQALAFGRLAYELALAIERHVELPAPQLPQLTLGERPTAADIAAAAAQTRQHWGLPPGPVGHVIRQLEIHGVLVLRLPDEITARVDAFSHYYPGGFGDARPVVLLNPAKSDRARTRFDAAHELGHLVMHHDTEPGSRVVENQAHSFAAEFLMPREQIETDLPRRLDWTVLHEAKRKWGASLKALLFRSHALGLLTEHSYKRGMMQLAQWGDPEPGDLGPPESPRVLSQALALLADNGISLDEIAAEAGLPAVVVDEVLAASADPRPALVL